MSKGKYQIMPDLDPATYAELKRQIAEHGVEVPVIVDEAGEILEGHSRARICAELGLDFPQILRGGLTEDQKVELALSLNLDRRHLTAEGREQVAIMLRQRGWSYRRIAERLGISHEGARLDVEAGVKKLTPDDEPMPEVVVGADGRTYQAQRLPMPPSAEVDDEDEEDVEAQAEADHEPKDPGDYPTDDDDGPRSRFEWPVEETASPEERSYTALARQRLICRLEARAVAAAAFSPSDDLPGFEAFEAWLHDFVSELRQRATRPVRVV